MGKKQLVSGVIVTAFWIVAAAGTALAGADEGKAAFEAKKCINCHTLGDQSGPMAKLGGPLDGVGGKRDAEWLRGYMADPKSKLPEAKMPKQKLTDQELADLVDYVLTLK